MVGRPAVTGELDVARRLLSEAEGVAVLSGAGLSAESGVPTFRGEGGLWRSYRAEDLATPQAFRRDPVLVWEWYAWRRGLVGACRPNAAHRSLARLALERPVAIVTQNVDGLHAVAATEEAGEGDPTPALPLELHGNLFRDRCSRCGARAPALPDVDPSTSDSLPRCNVCDGLLRPDVVWFGESLDPSVLQEAFVRASQADVCLVVGTSALVHPAASVPLSTLRAGGSLVEVNLERTPLSPHAAATLLGPAGEILPRLLG
jgi:NAD-dependent deacetylase